jgi:hypothetical protein
MDKIKPSSCFASLALLLGLTLAACAPKGVTSIPSDPPLTTTATQVFPPPTLTDPMITPSIQPTSTPARTEPAACRSPSDDYTLITINGHQLNQRTFEMLVYAQSLYDGPIDITDQAITQGSYTNAVEASFSTHAGGGAVDLSVIDPSDFSVLYAEIDPLIHALRLAGFAAWFRDFNNLYEGSPVHIHAIAIGDRELSLAAREQLAGPFGYFWGYDGLPQDDKIPQRDPHGGPILCDWMIEMGYPAKTATPSP